MVTLRTFRLPALAALVLSMVLFVAYPRTPARAVELGPAADTTFLALLNSLRVAKGLKPLAEGSELSSVARTWSSRMASSRTLAHNPALRTEVTGARVGENVGTGGAVQQIFNALVASPGHLRNMYDPLYTRIGVGSVTDASGVLWTTHVFQTPRSGTASVAPAAAAPAAPATTAAPIRRTATSPAPARSAPPAPATTASAPAPAPAAPSPVGEAAPVTQPVTTPDTGHAPIAVSSPVAAASTAVKPSGGFPLAAMLGGLGVLLAVAAATAFVLSRRSRDDGPVQADAGPSVARWYGGQPMPQ